MSDWELANSWELESTYPLWRGLSSLFTATVSIILLFITIFKTLKHDRSLLCKHRQIYKDRYGCNREMIAMPSLYDIVVCIYSLGFITFLSKGIGDLIYDDWSIAQKETGGKILLLIYVFCGSLIVSCVYAYYYAMIKIALDRTDIKLKNYAKALHSTVMIIATISTYLTTNH